jgi:hypothetical protein
MRLRKRVRRMRRTGGPQGIPRIDGEQATPAQKENEMLTAKMKPVPPPAAPAVSISVADAPPAANDESQPAVTNDLRNPLWIIAIGMAWFFGIVAAVIAAS